MLHRIVLITLALLALSARTAFAAPLSLGKVTVTANPLGRMAAGLTAPALVLHGPKLLERQAATIGQTLAGLPGVSASQFGPGASRPIIRGLGGDRVRVLENGLDTLDASDISPDHGVTVEPLIAQQIEVLEGPQTLLYGGGAFGGVVNVVDNRMPKYVPEDHIEGAVELRSDTASVERAGVATVDGGAGNFAFHLDGTRRKTSDYGIPRAAARQLGLKHDILPNTGIDSKNTSAGVSYVGDRGYLGFSYERDLNHYEIPIGTVTPDALAEGLPAIDQQQSRYIVTGELDDPFAGFESITFKADSSDYRHFELDGNTIGSQFKVNGDQGRLTLKNKPFFGWTGALGAEYTYKDYYVLGDALVPRNRTRSLGIFAVEQHKFGAFNVNAGLRYDRQQIDVQGDLPGQNKNAVTVSAGARWHFTLGYAAALSLARSQRIPASEELYFDGYHDATETFEVGDPNLGKETSRNINVSLRKSAGPLTGKVNLFINDIRDFIYFRRTGEFREGAPVDAFTPGHARFYGGEGELNYALPVTSIGRFKLGVFSDYVRARLTDQDQNVPRIPPLRYGLRFGYERGALRSNAEIKRVGRQDKTAPFETKTAGYTNLDLDLSYTFNPGVGQYIVFLRAQNLTDQVERNSTSFLKEIAPLPGRSIAVGVRASF
jgi:iron complex outermembrane receptor protein